MSIETSSIFSPAPAGIGLRKETRVAILFQRFGPYHHVRLNAVGGRLSVWGVEACGMEQTYAWEKVEGAAAFTRVTLTDRETGGRQWNQELHRKMRAALNDIKPDAVVIPGWASTDAWSAMEWSIENAVPLIMMSESTAWDEPRVAWKEWIKGRLVKLCAAGLVGGTPHADYLALLGMPRDRIFVGYDIVDNDYFSSKAAEVRSREEEVRTRLGLPGKYFLASARFIEKKNLPRLMEAYARYRQLAQPNAPSALKLDATSRCLRGSASPREPAVSPEPWDLVLLGDGPLRESLNQQLSNLNLAQHVHLPGFKQYNELPAYFGLAGAFVHASTIEQWGLVVNEAMASGLPVLVSRRCGCATDLVREGGNGFTFEHDNVEAIANLMLKISAPGFPLANFGAESRRIISSWGPERFAGGLCEAVTVALKKPPVRTGRIDRLLLRLVAKR